MRRRAVDALVLGAVALQIAYPLIHGAARDRLTVATVVVVAAASISHATFTRGRRGLGCCAVAAVAGFGADVVGVHTGVPFGDYRYAGSLGGQLAGVPIVAGLAWTMLAWPAALVARRLAVSVPARVLVGGWALASWDLFLDPQMVAAGHWRWADPDPHLPGVPTVPLTNFAGWLLVSTAISLAVQAILRPVRARRAPLVSKVHAARREPAGMGTDRRSSDHAVRPQEAAPPDDRWMFALYVWTYVSSVVALLAFLHLAGAALWGALGMGLVALPLLAVVRC